LSPAGLTRGPTTVFATATVSRGATAMGPRVKPEDDNLNIDRLI
jgi:hypothetical protein